MSANLESLRPTPRPPPWAAPPAARSPNEFSALSATFAAGAALAALDPAVRRAAPFDGAWRRRLALKAAAHVAERGRSDDEASLRDAFALMRPGGDPGPAGRRYVAWRALAEPGARLDEIAAALGAPPLAVADLAPIHAAHARSAAPAAPAPLAAAAAAKAVLARQPDARGLACAVADFVLAARLGWPAALPLLALEFASLPTPNRPAWDAAGSAAYARAAAAAWALYADLARAETRLRAAAPNLRAKGAPAVVAALLEDDVLTSAAVIPGVSDRGLRRLFDRLVALGAVREFSGRATFRLYGL